MARGPALTKGQLVFALNQGTNSVGRKDPSTTPDVDLAGVDVDRVVSRRHAELSYLSDGGVVIRDVGSKNGTFVNGVQLGPEAPARLNEGDTCGFGSLSLVFSGDAEWPPGVVADWAVTTRVKTGSGEVAAPPMSPPQQVAAGAAPPAPAVAHPAVPAPQPAMPAPQASATPAPAMPAPQAPPMPPPAPAHTAPLPAPDLPDSVKGIEDMSLHSALRAMQQLAVRVQELGQQEPASGPTAAERRERRERIERVMREGLIKPVFQPIQELHRKLVVGVESLSRIEAEPKRGPDKWFDEAFEVGLGIEMEVMAIRGALARLGELPTPLYMGINVSPETVLSPHFAEALEGVPPGRVVIEVTEHASVADYDTLKQALDVFRARGLRLAIDDVGSGFANMQHIIRLAPNMIKLDVALTRGIDNDSARSALASSLVDFAAQIGARIIAEGVETEQEYFALGILRVGYGQGYHIARPGQLPLPLDLGLLPPG
jgi:EAL domain-containing protein (putative c-di-GMP-specific phosphodiesterase class I)